MKRIGIITALTQEAACLTESVPEPEQPTPLDDDFLIIVSGAGAERASRAAARLIDAGAGALISFGFAGALAEHLDTGHVLVPDGIVTDRGRFAPSAAWRNAVLRVLEPGPAVVHGGAVACCDDVVSSPLEKRALHQRTGAVAVDMESAAVTAAAGKYGLPCLVVRTVLDTTRMTLPRAIMECSDPYGRVYSLALVRALVARPRLLPPLFELARALRAATTTLRWLGKQRQAILNVAGDTP